ncbi:MAG: signal recognition particle protein [Gammaproteobacteria bacterium]|nr:signal recognition particle protein [Gammaproteobacteria bacterium]
MFQNLSDRLGGVLDGLRGKGRLTDDNIKSGLREIRMALLEADVALPVVKDFISGVKERAVGAELIKSLKPGQVLVKIVHEELVRVMGEAAPIDFRRQPPVVILLAGLQGAGKTTSAAKMARRFQEKDKRKVMLASLDVYRPAAMDQLERLSGDVAAGFFKADSNTAPVAIAEAAVAAARKQGYDTLILDTAGRTTVDEAMMAEIRAIHAATDPAETLFVVDAMTGQDAAKTAAAFGEALPLSGIVLTKADGDARGGAALSARSITGAPIKFLGTGEKTERLEPFDPERVASRILGMGDVLSLVEDVQDKVDQDQAQKLAKKLKSGKGFDLADFSQQLAQMESMGGMAGLMEKLPGGAKLAKGKDQMDHAEREIRRQRAIINSMTPKERRRPDVINGSRKRRIAAGSGLQVQDVNRLLKQFTQMQKMMKKMQKGGLKKMMRGMGGPGGGMGGGFPGF